MFSNSNAKKTVKILSKDGAELNSMSVDVDKGYNYISYNLELSEQGRKALMKSDKELKIAKANNGKYYLPKGVYTVQVGDAKTKLELK